MIFTLVSGTCVRWSLGESPRITPVEIICWMSTSGYCRPEAGGVISNRSQDILESWYLSNSHNSRHSRLSLTWSDWMRSPRELCPVNGFPQFTLGICQPSHYLFKYKVRIFLTRGVKNSRPYNIFDGMHPMPNDLMKASEGPKFKGWSLMHAQKYMAFYRRTFSWRYSVVKQNRLRWRAAPGIPRVLSSTIRPGTYGTRTALNLIPRTL